MLSDDQVHERFNSSLPEQTIPDLMLFENAAAEYHHDDAQMHHFLDTNLYRARPRVRQRNFQQAMRQHFVE
jgi:hypothetical protein